MASTDQDVHESDSGLDILTSTQSASTSITTRPKRARHKFSSWTFQLKFSADAAALNGGPASVPLQERQKYLLEHIRSRIINTDIMPRIFTFVEAYYDAFIISGALSDGISISIPLLGFVQTRACTNSRRRVGRSNAVRGASAGYHDCGHCATVELVYFFPKKLFLIEIRTKDTAGRRL